MTARCVSTLAILQLAITVCHAVNGVIWCKEKQEFVQLFSIPQFAVLQKENLAKRRALEAFDMKHEVIKAVFYEERNMVMFINNDTKITGICGDLWYLLADYLKFTIIPMKTAYRNYGERGKNGSYSYLAGIIERNEAQVLLRSGFSSNRRDVLDYTMPIWKTSFRIYVRPQQLYDNKWLFTLFTMRMWYSIIILLIIMSLLGYFLQKMPKNSQVKRGKKGSVNFCLSDHFFYSFAIMCSQGYIPDGFHSKFKILSLSKSIFAWLIISAFSSNLIYRMTNREPKPPFTDLESLLNNTEYKLLTLDGSYFQQLLQDRFSNDKKGQEIFARIHLVANTEEMYHEICNDIEKYAIYDTDDRYMIFNIFDCFLLPIKRYNSTWVTFAFRKNLPYTRTINAALIKFNEVGLTDYFKNHWLRDTVETSKENKFKMIDFNQVLLIFSTLCCGILISLVVFVLEKIAYYHETNSTSRRRK